ncbi:SMC family ATPase [Clostridium sp. PL3]|uniref:SMC family ATPase n=1 Tax=Clostridium thailandense TaxID=2794346 RepID=A0A949TSI9_9CLOT|nr:AAA family ATPase [Clostridium thailandense]MBV7271508.1 SMC family ATPase [Clostridium thailandense]
MKPIKLKIKGLNSFIDSQEINFEKLTDKGLFGIFGPTGSGKSTILDGITLALYGEVARKSSNFMNTNCDALNVSFEFRICEKEIKRYRVDREFRRERKTGSIRSKSAKVIDITEEEEVILEEGASTVTKKCEEIIGLKLEDFTRTVVLPQGKFSEFLKLEGRERRNMLERLFNLQKYGDNLSIKLSNKIRKEKQKADILEGELKGYEGISEEILKEKTKTLSEIKEKCGKCQIELKDAEESFNKGKEIWNLQKELKEQIDRENELKEKEEEINKSQRKALLGESALKVKPYIDSFENTLAQIEAVNNELSNLTRKVETIKENKEKIEAALNIVKNKKDKELPDLKIKEQKVIDAIEEKVLLNALIKEKKVLKENISKIEEDLKVTGDKIEKSELNLNNVSNDISDKEQKVETLKISEEYKKKVNEAIVILNNHENLMKQKNKLSKEIKNALSNIEEAQRKSEVLSKELKEKEELIHINKESLEKLIETYPGDQNTLLTLQEKLSLVKEKWDKHRDYNAALSKSKNVIETLRKELEIKEKEKVSLQQELNQINDNIKKIEVENLAHTLREALLEGEACPVCGSKEHHIENVEILDSSNLKQLKTNLSKKENKNKKLEEEIIKTQTNVKTEEENEEEMQKKLNELGEDFKTTSVEFLQSELNKLKANISEYNTEKTALENKIKFLTEEKNVLDVEYNKENVILTQNRSQLKKLQEDLKVTEEEFEKVDEELSVLKAELAIEDFKGKNDEIIQKEKEKANLEKEIKVLRDKLKLEQTQKERFNKEAGDLREELKGKETTLIEKNKNIEEKEKSIKNKVGDVEDLDKLKKEISQTITKIEKEYMEAEKLKNEVDEKYNECNKSIIAAQGNLSSLKDRSIDDKEKLENILKEESIKDIEEARRNFIVKTEIDKLKLKIEEYKNSLARLAGTIESLKKKIDNRNLTEEQWLKIQNIKNEKDEILKNLEETKIKLDTEVKTISERLLEKNKLLEKKEELDYKLSLLDDLDKLFKGKRFVEFVAANQLKYVSLEASKRLKEITAGNYGLAVDENGKFLIRDYKNGGKERDASTLSGGETFVTSLALALALSAQIQLKGTAPLELFFLDEGFGTLDDNLLEVVMDSLEKIHNDKLSIGIISHVESIKNRVPVKLIVTAAEAGMGGSKVRIERS